MNKNDGGAQKVLQELKVARGRMHADDDRGARGERRRPEVSNESCEMRGVAYERRET